MLCTRVLCTNLTADPFSRKLQSLSKGKVQQLPHFNYTTALAPQNLKNPGIRVVLHYSSGARCNPAEAKICCPLTFKHIHILSMQALSHWGAEKGMDCFMARSMQ